MSTGYNTARSAVNTKSGRAAALYRAATPQLFMLSMADGAITHCAGDGFESSSEWLYQLTSFRAGRQRPLDHARRGLDDAQQYPGGTVGNGAALLPLLHRANAKAELLSEFRL
jgi:hypothetical protein